MRSGPTLATREKKRYPETDESGQFSRSAMIDMDSRLRVARGIATNETLASIEVFRTLRRCGHPHGPPPTISDGWGGIDEAMIEVYGEDDRRPRREQVRIASTCKWSSSVMSVVR